MNAAAPRSGFVTVLGWVGVALSGFATLIALLQNVLVQLVFPPDAFGPEALRTLPPGMPFLFVFAMGHFRALLLATLLVGVFTLVCSIGLLRRWNWARLAFVVLLVVGIAWNLLVVGMQFAMTSGVRHQLAANAGPDAPNLGPFLLAMAAVGAVVALAFSVLYGWLAHKLLSAPIAAEFRR